MKARSALFTLFGDVVRPAGGEAWLSTISACMATVGFSSQAVRTALHRMSAEGWVEPRREGRYAAYGLTKRGLERLEEAAKRIYRLRSLEWDGCWRLLLAPGLSAAAAIAELEWIGYGQVQPGVWAYPHPHPSAARAVIRRCEVPSTWVDHARVADDRALAATAWALPELRQHHLAFLQDWGQVAIPSAPADIFAMRLRLVHQWRSFLFLDPGLPPEVLPTAWAGFTAATTFATVYEQLREPSWAFFAAVQRQAATPVSANRIIQSASPFAQGLAALHQD
ncbi:MAG: PaaX family transcriptional regulator [Euzebya sp.]